MYSSPYDDELIVDQMAAVFINQRPDTLIGAEIGKIFYYTLFTLECFTNLLSD